MVSSQNPKVDDQFVQAKTDHFGQLSPIRANLLWQLNPIIFRPI